MVKFLRRLTGSCALPWFMKCDMDIHLLQEDISLTRGDLLEVIEGNGGQVAILLV